MEKDDDAGGVEVTVNGILKCNWLTYLVFTRCHWDQVFQDVEKNKKTVRKLIRLGISSQEILAVCRLLKINRTQRVFAGVRIMEAVALPILNA